LEVTLLTRVVDGDDIRLVEFGENLLLSQEAGLRQGTDEPVADHFQGNPAVEYVLHGLVHLAHPALGDKPDNEETPKPLPRLELP
jgi:hypothetical protein